MKLELEIDNKKKIFTVDHAKGRHYRKLLEYDEKMDYNQLTVDDIDELVGFICEVFQNKFDVDTFYDGIPSNKLIPTITDVFVFVRTGKTPKELAKDQGNAKGEQ